MGHSGESIVNVIFTHIAVAQSSKRTVQRKGERATEGTARYPIYAAET